MNELSNPNSDKEAVSKKRTVIPPDMSNCSPTELTKLVNELYSRNEYLEAQIEELRKEDLEYSKFRDKYIDMYDSAPVGYLTASKGCKILEANLTAAHLLGIDRSQLIGQSLYSLIPDEEKDLFFVHLMNVFRIEIPTTCELKLRKFDGTEFSAELRSISEKSVYGRQQSFKIVISNVTKRRQSEILQRKLKDNLESLWELSRTPNNDLKLLADRVLEEIKRISESRYAFYGFVNEQETEMEIYSWSKLAMNVCKIDKKPRRFPVTDAGIWADAVRKRQSIVINDYSQDHPGKLGLPEGHVGLTRFASIPVFSKGRIVAIGAVANKESDYTEDDVKQLEAFLSHSQIMADQILLQNSLSESEIKFRTVADFTHDWEYWIAPDGVLTYVSPSCERISGYSPDEFINNPGLLLDIVHPEDLSLGGKFLAPVESDPPLEREFRILTRMGETRWIGQACQSVYSIDGDWLGRRVSNRDITKRKLAELDLLASEERWQFALQGARDGVWDFNVRTKEVFYSRQWKSMLGYREDEIGSSLNEWESRLHPEDRKLIHTIANKRYAPESPGYEAEFRMLCKDGDYKWILSRGKAIEWTDDGMPCRFIGTHTDITSRKLTEEALRERERVWATLIKNLPGFVYRCANDRYWTMEYVSHGCLEITGYTPDDFIGNKNLSYNDIVDPDYRKPLWEKWQELLTHQGVFEKEYPIINRSGETRWVWERGQGIFSDDGRLLFLEGFITDITQRRRIQEGLRDSHENFRAFFEAIDDIIVVCSQDGKIIYSNSALTRKLGYTNDELKTMNVLDLNPRSQRHDAESIFSEMLAGLRMSCPLPLQKKDGTLIPSETRVWFGKWSGLHALFGICKDLSKEQEALQRFNELFDFNPNPLALSSVEDRKFVEINEAFLSTLGFSRDEIIGKNSDDLDLFTDPQAQKEVSDKLKAQGAIRNVELQIRNRNGHLVEGLFSGTIIVSQGQKYLLTTMIDITERKQAEEALRKSESNLRSFFQTISESVFLMKPDGEILEANETFASRLGKKPEEVIGRCVFDFLEPETTIKRKRWIDEVIRSGKPMRIEDERQNSILVHNLYPVFNSEGMVDRLAVYANDVTGVRRSEAALRASEARFRLIVEAANEGIWSMDGEFRTTFVNRRMAEMIGYSPEEMLGRPVDSFMFDEDMAYHRARMAGRIAGMNESYERRFRKKDGTEIWTLVSATSLIDKNLGFQGSFAMFTDITERKRTEAALIERESYLRTLLMSMINGFALFESVFDERDNFISCKFILVNQSYERISDVKDEDVRGRTIHEVWPEIEHEWIEAFGKVAQTGTPSSFEMFHKPTGNYYYCNVYRPGHSRNRFCLVIEDISAKVRATQEKEALRAQILQAQKIEAIGTLAGGIAHDHNNIIQAILGYTELAMNDVPQESPVYSNLERVLQAAKRSGNMMKQILTFSRRSTPQVTTIDVGPLVKEGLRFLRAAILSTIEIEGRVHSNLGKILADPTQIHQVLMNLCINASQAMKNGKGKILVELTEINLPDNSASPHPELAMGKYLILKVTDTGEGISPEIIDKIFDPYFTTKESGGGTGLGLSVAHGIVSSFNGVITVESTPGEGTTFNVFFPVLKDEIKVEPECHTTTIPKGSEHVLFVDDEIALLEMYERQLKGLGYQMTGVDSPGGALQILSQHPRKFSVVVVDLMMPDMNGLELAEKIRSGWPDIPIIMCTGWGQAISDDAQKQNGIEATVTKPARKNEIAHAIRTVIDRKCAGNRPSFL